MSVTTIRLLLTERNLTVFRWKLQEEAVKEKSRLMQRPSKANTVQSMLYRNALFAENAAIIINATVRQRKTVKENIIGDVSTDLKTVRKSVRLLELKKQNCFQQFAEAAVDE